MKQHWLITGASGLLGHNACAYFVAQGYDVTGLCHGHSVDVPGVREIKADLLDFDATQKLVRDLKPDVILHCAAMTNVDTCESDPQATSLYHVDLSRKIAESAVSVGAKMIQISTDQLWDGTQSFVQEETPTAPLNVYGQSKAEGEQVVLGIAPNAMVVRTNFFGRGRPWRKSFSDWLDSELSQGNRLNGFTDIHYTPIAIPDLLVALDRLVRIDFSGIIHLVGSERISKYEFMTRYASMAGFDPALIKPEISASAHLKARRPQDMSLAVKKIESLLGYTMPSVSEGIRHVLDHYSEQQRKVS